MSNNPKDLKGNAKMREKNKEIIENYKMNSNGCVLCGYSEHKEILEPHHTEEKTDYPKYKKRLSRMAFVRINMGPQKVLEELKKCILLCPNCHTWLHYQKGYK